MDDSLIRLPVTHPTGHYQVIVGHGQLPHLRELLGVNGQMAIISDSNVTPLYGHLFGESQLTITMPAGEENKTLETIRMIYETLLAARFDRSGTIVAVGGGVVGDVAGFAAATFMRGVNFVQCPTTVLAMVDASVGGKTGVDLPQGKNLVGAFKQPVGVIADLSTLETLPPAEYAAGLAEVVKHGVIADPDILDVMEVGEGGSAGRPPWGEWDLKRLVTSAISVKRDIVQDDPFEQGRRMVLNLGHTFAHAVEQVSAYSIRHGEAVSIGLVAAARLSVSLGYASHDLVARLESLLARLQLPTRIPANLPPEQLMAAMGSDKKRASGRQRYVLVREVGDVFVSDDVRDSDVKQTLAELKA